MSGPRARLCRARRLRRRVARLRCKLGLGKLIGRSRSPVLVE